MGNSSGRAPWGRSDTEVTSGWTEGKPWEIAWGDVCWEGTDGSDDRAQEGSVGKKQGGSEDKVDGRETVGNSLGRAPLGRSDTEATTRWTNGKPLEIAWGELRPLGRSDTEATNGWTELCAVLLLGSLAHLVAVLVSQEAWKAGLLCPAEPNGQAG